MFFDILPIKKKDFILRDKSYNQSKQFLYFCDVINKISAEFYPLKIVD